MRRLALFILVLMPLVCGCGREENPGGEEAELPAFNVSPVTVTAGNTACVVLVEVEAGCGWRLLAPSTPEWLTIEAGDSSLSLNMTENAGIHDREYSFLVVPFDHRLQSVGVSVLQSGPAADADRNTVICALASKHLTQKAAARIALLYPGGLESVAPDLSRFLQIDKYNAYTPAMRRLAMNADGVYDPNFTQADGGDCLRGLRFADYYLSHLSRFTLPDEELYFYHSLMVTMLEDLHDPTLPVTMPGGASRPGSALPFEGLSLDGIIRTLDTWTEDEAASRCGSPYTVWAQETCSSADQLDALRAAGYRLASLLNAYYKD